ncbi:hypothetical protein APHACPA_0291 [Rickettsia amblyommatis str. Ac/Pa]|uniref:Uncharacterized protein n=1 Tax=Rickettsia amblyommatis str. Ac/Pa TaxID=1359164 RepID=A0A0F3MZU5_RICAM|nr:hypothetical protein APHACPA_0291 [Rickettsia amblyommatis str. Ac/Pa]
MSFPRRRERHQVGFSIHATTSAPRNDDLGINNAGMTLLITSS